jgi:D-sedoheptulose 7-phosphate isomerase
VEVQRSLAVQLAGCRNLLSRIPVEDVVRASRLMTHAASEERSVFTVGNGGSAATASHSAADLQRTLSSRAGRLKVVSLADNAALLTGLANDHGHERVFSEQIRRLADAGDVLVAYSVSGCSENVVQALAEGRARAMPTVAFLGMNGGDAAALADVAVIVPSHDYGLVETVHLLLAHLVAEAVAAQLGPLNP